MSFDNFLAGLFSKATAFLVGIVALVSSFFGVSAANAQGTVQCTEYDCISCMMCGCLTPETTCDIIDCFEIRVCGACNDAAEEATCAALLCITDCGRAYQDCLYENGCYLSCEDSSFVSCLDENCTDENGNPACNGKTACVCTDENGNPTCASPEDSERVDLSELKYGEIIGDYYRLLDYDEFVDIAWTYYTEDFYYSDYAEYVSEYNRYYGTK